MTKTRRELSAKFLSRNARAARKQGGDDIAKMVALTEILRKEVLLPSSEKIRQGQLQATHKDTGDMRGGDAKTITVETDNIAENRLIELQRETFPNAFIIGEEMFGQANTFDKKKMMKKALTHKGLVIMNDSLDGTRPFTQGKDGFGTMVTMVRGGQITGAVVQLTTQFERQDGLGYILTWQEGDCVRMDGEPLKPLTERTFPKDAKMLRGYAGFEFLKGTDALRAAFSMANPPTLGQKFDSMSDLWTCGTLYRDMLQGRHHFMIVPAPVDIFDYPMGIALLEQAGGIARFADGTRATLEEIFKRQGFGQEDGGKLKGLDIPEHFRSPENTLILAVSEDVFKTVQETLRLNVLDTRRSTVATRLALAGQNPAHADGGSAITSGQGMEGPAAPAVVDIDAIRKQDGEVNKALSVIDLFDSKRFDYVSSPTLYSKELFALLQKDTGNTDTIDAIIKDVVSSNVERLNKHAEGLKAKGDRTLILPARFNDTAFPFTPVQRMAFLYGVMNEKASTLQLMDGWTYSPSCIEEYLNALMIQTGRIGRRNDISIADERGARIEIWAAVSGIARSIQNLLNQEKPLLVHAQADNFLQLCAVAQQAIHDMRQYPDTVNAECLAGSEKDILQKLLQDIAPLRQFLEKQIGVAYKAIHPDDPDGHIRQIGTTLTQKRGVLRHDEQQLLKIAHPQR